MTVRTFLAPLAVVAAALALTAGACNPERPGTPGLVIAHANKRWDCTGHCKARLWLTTRDSHGTHHRFQVSPPTFRACAVGDTYPACKP